MDGRTVVRARPAMEIHQVRYFLALCETMNFTRAAEQCHVAQPSLTRAIKALEDELGGPLFNRERNRSHLTELGKTMRPYLEQAWRAMNDAKGKALDFVRLKQAPLNVGIMCTIGPLNMLDLIAEFRQRYPGIDLVLRDATGRQLHALLLNGDLDVAIYGLSSLDDERVHAHPLYSEKFAVAIPPGHRFDGMTAVPLKEVDGEPYLTRLNCELLGVFDETLTERGLRIKLQYSTDREDWIQCMVQAGLGIAFIPEFMALLSGLTTRPLIEPEFERSINLVTVRGRPHTPAVGAFVRTVLRHRWAGSRAVT
ncbi:MAG: LysR family transcriptional regulator [Dongiaceae bacterium]